MYPLVLYEQHHRYRETFARNTRTNDNTQGGQIFRVAKTIVKWKYHILGWQKQTKQHQLSFQHID